MKEANLENEKANIEKLLKEGHTIRIKPKGYSMYPLFVPGRDEAVIAPVSDVLSLKRGDVVLYRREGSVLVMHRICKHREGKIYCVGDNEHWVEGPLRADQIKGILVEIVRKGKQFSVKQPLYRLLSAIWLAFRPLRPILYWAAAKVKPMVKHFFGGIGKIFR